MLNNSLDHIGLIDSLLQTELHDIGRTKLNVIQKEYDIIFKD